MARPVLASTRAARPGRHWAIRAFRPAGRRETPALPRSSPRRAGDAPASNSPHPQRLNGGSISRSLVRGNLRLFVQQHVQQRPVDLDGAVVLDKPELSKLVHEMVDVGPAGAD